MRLILVADFVGTVFMRGVFSLIADRSSFSASCLSPMNAFLNIRGCRFLLAMDIASGHQTERNRRVEGRATFWLRTALTIHG
jgi:hypothetical protein